MVAPGRVELPTFGLGNRCSIHLSYGAMATETLSHVNLPTQLSARIVMLKNRPSIEGAFLSSRLHGIAFQIERHASMDRGTTMGPRFNQKCALDQF